MSLLSELKPNKGATSSKKRVGRGLGSGLGGTAGKGHKGQKARSGKGKNLPGFEGGQMPMARRLPKFGFNNKRFRVSYDIVNVEQLAKFDGDVTLDALTSRGLVSKHAKVKLLGNGKLDKALTVKVHKVSEGAKKIVEAAGGRVEIIG